MSSPTRYAIIDDIQPGDHVLVWDTSNGDWREISWSDLITYLQENLALTDSLVKQYYSPSATGFSVTILSINSWLILTPTAGFAAGTIVLPTGIDMGEVQIFTTQAITTLTITPPAGDSVIGAPTTLAANGYFTLRYDAVTKVWYRVN